MNRRGRTQEREPDTRATRSPEPIAQPACRIGTAAFLDGVVVHDGRTGTLFQLNRTAAQIWRRLQQGEHAEAIVRAIARAHAADPVAVRRDFEAFVAAARSAGLLGSSAEDAGDGAMAPPAPRGAPALDGAYRVGEAVVRVSCYPADVAAAFAPLAAPAAVPAARPAHARLALFRAGGAFVLTCEGRLVERLDTAPTARWAMVRQLVALGRRRPWLALLHAGALAGPAGGLLLCGDSGAGKSSLLAGLVHAGFPFIADDIVPVEAGSGLIWPVPLAISIKHGSWPAISGLFPQLARAPIIRFGGRSMRYLWPDARALAEHSSGYAAAAVLFPRYAEDAPVTRTRLEPARALALLGEGGSVLPATDAGLAEFLAWWGRLPAYRLCYGRLEEAVAAVRALGAAACPDRSGAAAAAAVSMAS